MRIFIACRAESLRVALLLLLDHEPGMVVAGISDRSEGLLILVKTLQPEVLLLDYELAKDGTVDLVKDLHRLENRPKIIVLSINTQIKETVLAAGADDFIGKNVPPDELLPIVRRMRQSMINTSLPASAAGTDS